MNRNIFFVLAFATLMVFSAVVTVPVQAAITWPNWNEVAVAYPDPTGDGVKYGFEDMTVCYITHDDEFLYIRIELAEPNPKYMVIAYIYLDVDQNQMTGDSGTEQNYGFDLHDIGAEWRIVYPKSSATSGSIEVSPISKWDAMSNSWQGTAFSYAKESGDKYINLALRLSDLNNLEFPINALFITHADIDESDWNPNVGHITYPPLSPVGGEVYPVSSSALLTSWIALIIATVAAGTVILSKRKLFLQ